MAKNKKLNKKKKISSTNKVEKEKQLIVQRFIRGGQLLNDSFEHIVARLMTSSHSEGLKCFIYEKYFEIPAFKSAFTAKVIKQDHNVSFYKAAISKDMSLDSLLYFAFTNILQLKTEAEAISRLQLDIGKFILSSDWSRADEALDELEAIGGVSLWSISTRFSIHFFSEKYDSANKYISNLPVDLERISKIQIKYEKTRADETTTAKKHLDSLNRQIEDLRLNGFDELSNVFKLDHYFDPKDPIGEIGTLVKVTLFSRLTDQLCYFKRLFKLAVLQKYELERTTKKILDSNFDDIELITIAKNYMCEFDNEAPRDKALKDIVSNYLLDDFAKTYKLSSEFLSRNPSTTCIYEILAKSAVATSQGINTDLTVLKKIVNKFIDVINGERIESNLNDLEKYYLNLKQFEFSCHIKAFIDKYSDINKDAAKTVYNYSDLSQIVCSPFNLEYIYDGIKDDKRKKNIKDWFVEYQGIYELCLQVSGQPSDLPVWRRSKIDGEISLMENNFERAISSFRQGLNNCNPTQHKELLPKLIVSLYKAGSEIEALELLANKLLETRKVRVLPVEFIAEKLIDNLRRSNNVRLLENIAIVLYFYNYYTSSGDITQILSNVTENLLMLKGVEDVADIKTTNWSSNIFILTHIMNVDVIDGFIRILADDLDMYTVRMEICQQLLEMKQIQNDKNLHDYVVSDYNSSFNRLINYFCSSSLSNGRIQIEKEQLKVKLTNDLKGLYSVATTYEKSPWYKSRLGFNVELEQRRNNDIYLLSIVEKIKDEYTTNKLFGLDNSLNIGIRHGGLFNHLWAPIKTNKINGVKKENSYKVDSIFDDYSLLNKEVIDEYKARFSKFLTDLEKMYLSFKNRCYVNSSQEVKVNERFFNFQYKEEDIKDIFEKINGGMTLSSLIEYIFTRLDEKTTFFLERIRKHRIPELRVAIEKLYSDFLTDVGNAPTQLLKSVNLAKQQSLSRCDSLKDWFDWSGEAASDFTVSSALEQAYSLVQSLHPSANFNVNVSDLSTHIFAKNEYTSFVSILVLIKENVVKHAGFSYDFTVSDKFEEKEGFLYLRFSNEISSNARKEVLKKLNKINTNLDGEVVDLASQESSSGIYKIKLILNYKLNYQSIIRVGVEGNQFYVNIKIKL